MASRTMTRRKMREHRLTKVRDEARTLDDRTARALASITADDRKAAGSVLAICRATELVGREAIDRLMVISHDLGGGDLARRRLGADARQVRTVLGLFNRLEAEV